MNIANARKRTVNVRVHLSGRGVRFEVAVVRRQGEVVKCYAAIAFSLREVGYGG